MKYSTLGQRIKLKAVTLTQHNEPMRHIAALLYHILASQLTQIIVSTVFTVIVAINCVGKANAIEAGKSLKIPIILYISYEVVSILVTKAKRNTEIIRSARSQQAQHIRTLCVRKEHMTKSSNRAAQQNGRYNYIEHFCFAKEAESVCIFVRELIKDYFHCSECEATVMQKILNPQGDYSLILAGFDNETNTKNPNVLTIYDKVQ